MRMINLVGATSVTDPSTGTVYDAGPDGVFDLPHAFAMELATRHAGHWRVESEHEAAQSAARKAELRNPRVLTDVVADLRIRLTKAEARIEELGAQLAEVAARLAGVIAPTEGTQDEGAEHGDARPARARKATAKKTAAKPPAE